VPLHSSSHRVSLPSGSQYTSGVSALLRRFSNLFNYTGGVALAGQPPTNLLSLINDHAHDASLHPASSATVHQYILKSRGREYAQIIVRSHALNAHDPPVLYFGEDITGFVILSLSDLSDMQSMDVVVSQSLIGLTAVEPGTCSCRCSIWIPLFRGLRSSALYHRSRSMNLISQAEIFAGPLLLHPQPSRFRRQAHRLIRPLVINRPMTIALVAT